MSPSGVRSCEDTSSRSSHHDLTLRFITGQVAPCRSTGRRDIGPRHGVQGCRAGPAFPEFRQQRGAVLGSSRSMNQAPHRRSPCLLHAPAAAPRRGRPSLARAQQPNSARGWPIRCPTQPIILRQPCPSILSVHRSSPAGSPRHLRIYRQSQASVCR